MAARSKIVSVAQVTDLNSHLTNLAAVAQRQSLSQASYASVGVPRAACALRWDDGYDTDYSVVYPLLLARSLPGGFAITNSLVGVAGRLTAANLLTMQDNGMEIMHHSRSHPTATSLTDAQFLDETVAAADDLAALNNLRVRSFVQPGSWTGGLLWDDLADFQTARGWAMMARYANVEAYVPPVYQPIPASPWGRCHILGTGLSLTGAKAYFDTCLKQSSAFEMLFHGVYADLAALLDYIVTLIPKGLSVLTPTALCYAHRGASQNWIMDPGFELSATGALIGWSVVSGTPQIVAGGRTGNCARVNSSNTLGVYYAKTNTGTFKFTGYAKADAANVNAYVQVNDSGTSRLTCQKATAVTSAGWTKITACFGTDTANEYANANDFRVRLMTDSANWVLWDDITLERL